MKTAQYGIADIVDWKQFGNKLIVQWQAPMDTCSGTLELSADHPMLLQSKNVESKQCISPLAYPEQSVFRLK